MDILLNMFLLRILIITNNNIKSLTHILSAVCLIHNMILNGDTLDQ